MWYLSRYEVWRYVLCMSMRYECRKESLKDAAYRALGTEHTEHPEHPEHALGAQLETANAQRERGGG